MSSAAEPEDDCPVLALGTCEGVYFFRTPSGERRRMVWLDFTDIGLISLFEGDTRWMVSRHPLMKGEHLVDDFDQKGVAADMMRRCHNAGFWDEVIHSRRTAAAKPEPCRPCGPTGGGGVSP